MMSFDDAAQTYDAWYATPVGRLTDELERRAVFSLVPAQPGWAADLSCGTGHYALELARRGWRVVGIDRSLPMLRVATGKLRRSDAAPPFFVQADAALLPLRAESLNLVTVILGLEFTADPAAVLREVRRVLDARGVLVVAVLRARGLWNRWRRVKRHLVTSIWTEACFFEEAALETLLRAHGFTPGVRRRCIHYVPWPSSRRLLGAWERMAGRWFPELAAFLTMRSERTG